MWATSMFLRRLTLFAGLLAIAAVAACSSSQTQPVLVPAMAALNATGDYGYSETALDSDRYEVTFVTPNLSAHGDPEDDYGLIGERQRTYDLALWRAAQLAQEKGYRALQVETESRDVEVDIVDPPGPPPFVSAPLRTMSGPPCRWDCGRPIGYWGDPYFNPAYDNWYRRAHSGGRVSATLTVKLLPQRTAGAQDAAATAERMRTIYASSTFNVR
jgi:hypothetical protein